MSNKVAKIEVEVEIVITGIRFAEKKPVTMLSIEDAEYILSIPDRQEMVGQWEVTRTKSELLLVSVDIETKEKKLIKKLPWMTIRWLEEGTTVLFDWLVKEAKKTIEAERGSSR